MRRITTILGVPFDKLNMDEAAEKAMELIGTNGQHIVCTPNPEIVMLAREDKELMNILRAADMVVPDGIGIVLASKLTNEKLKERVAGYDLCQNLFLRLKDTDKKIFFFGGAPGVASSAAKRMANKYQGLNVCGYHNGYFKQNEEKAIIDEIRNAKTDILLVGLGAPKQEKWIYNNMRFTGVKLCIGVGGCFDVMAENVKRAPMIFQRFGLEWFYRLLKQPSRFMRIIKLPEFVFAVIKQRGRKK